MSYPSCTDEVSGMGVNLDAFRVAGLALAARGGETRMLSTSVYPNIPLVPPCLLMPRIANEPLRLDWNVPPHPRGLGLRWPPESRISDSDLPSRCPLALVLHAFATSELQTCWQLAAEPKLVDRTFAMAIAAAYRWAVRSAGGCSGIPALVVPNDLSISKQQALIDSCRMLGQDVKLIWRPVAAALAWLHSCGLSGPIHSDSVQFEDRMVLCVHLGLEQLEFAVISLRCHRDRETVYLVPARKRSNVEFGSCGSHGLGALLNQCLRTDRNSLAEPADLCNWGRCWGTGLLIDELLNPELDRAGCAVFLNSSPVKMSREVDPLQILSSGVVFLQLQERFPLIRRSLARQLVVGAVFTGELTNVPAGGNRRLWQVVLEELNLALPTSRVLTEYLPGDRRSILAHGAAVFSDRNQRGWPTYFDVLPRLDIAAYVGGVPTWIPLLSGDQTAVLGGRIWRRKDPVRGLRVRKGFSSLDVTLAHEDFETARSVHTAFEEPVPEDMPVSLRVSIEPGQGNAIVELLSEAKGRAKGRGLLLNWRSMLDLEMSPQRWLEKHCPTLFPEPIQRMNNRLLWGVARDWISRFVKNPSISAAATVVEKLRHREDLQRRQDGRTEEKTTAVGSDGVVPAFHKAELTEFIGVCLNAISKSRAGSSEMAGKLTRAVGYTATDDARVQRLIGEWLALRKGALDSHRLVMCGQCIRNADQVALFATHFRKRLSDPDSRTTNWIKAFAEILRYREHATERVSLAECNTIAILLVNVLRSQVQQGQFQYTFNYSALAIAFLLRKRAYDDSFLRPDTSAYAAVKAAFLEGQATVSPREHANAAKAARTISLLLKYLDREGPAVLSGGAELASLVE